MTFVGKLLVFFIIVFAVGFLTISTVVFTTESDWKKQADAKKKQLAELKTKNDTLAAQIKNLDAGLESEKQESKAKLDALGKQLADSKTQTDERQKEIENSRTTIEKSQESAKLAMDEAALRVKETDVLRETLKSVQDQANEYKLRQTELNDEIRVLKRELDTATKNNEQLRERAAVFSAKLRSLGQTADFEQLKGVAAPPADVEGEVDKVDANNRRIEITIGSDDGLVVGHTLELYRFGADPKYLGKVKIISVEPDRAVAEVVGKTVRGEKIQEHDIVATKIRPRG
jgi:chromosome segregation ATPase